MEYWYCAYNVNCTSNYIVRPPGFGVSAPNLIILQPNGSTIWLGNICVYQIIFPSGSSSGDILSIIPNMVSRAQLYYMIGTSMTDAGIVSKGFV